MCSTKRDNKDPNTALGIKVSSRLSTIRGKRKTSRQHSRFGTRDCAKSWEHTPTQGRSRRQCVPVLHPEVQGGLEYSPSGHELRIDGISKQGNEPTCTKPNTHRKGRGESWQQTGELILAGCENDGKGRRKTSVSCDRGDGRGHDHGDSPKRRAGKRSWRIQLDCLSIVQGGCSSIWAISNQISF